MIGDWSKYYIAALILMIFLSLFLGQIVLAGMPEPPGENEARFLLEKISSSTNALFRKISDRAKGVISAIVPFFENAGAKVSSWWLNQIKPWLLKQWSCLNLYLNQEIRI